jgi:hypothetical protein
MALEEYIAQEIALDCKDGLLSRREALRRLGLMMRPRDDLERTPQLARRRAELLFHLLQTLSVAALVDRLDGV